jgi:putative transposase
VIALLLGAPPCSRRRLPSPEFKARVAMEAISGRKTLQEIAADGAERLIQVIQWM